MERVRRVGNGTVRNRVKTSKWEHVQEGTAGSGEMLGSYT
jgi:hypothetical protein